MYLVWNPDPVLFTVGGFAVGWYGVLFMLGFFLSQRFMIFVYAREGKPAHDVLLWYLVAGVIIGGRLGHCLFYDPVYFLRHPLEILKVWEGGLASHGAVAGMVAALALFSRRYPEQGFAWLLDRITIAALMTGALVRFGNFINSEIIGDPTGLRYGVVFVADALRSIGQQPGVLRVAVERRSASDDTPPGFVPLTLTVDARSPTANPAVADSYVRNRLRPGIFRNAPVCESLLEAPGEGPSVVSIPEGIRAEFPVLGIARHPVQLYECIGALALAIGFFAVWWKMKAAVPPGFIFGWCLVLLFTFRFFVEFLKEDVSPIETGLPLKMGQFLSIPLVAVGVWIHQWSRRQKKE
jgi:phosphatidylglycerol:prolipoprotein diacylglycerol transferase